MRITRLETSRRHDVSLALLLAAVATAAMFAVVRVVTPKEYYLYVLFWDRGPIQFLSTFCFWVTLSMLAAKHIRFVRERKAYEAGLDILEDPKFGFALTWESADSVRQEFTDSEYSGYRDTLTFATVINGLDRLRKTQSTAELDDYFRMRGEVLAGDLETSYASIRYLIWLIPTLGFIGTVLGIGRAMAGFAEIIQGAESFTKVKEHLPYVTRELGTAFDTTLLALSLSVFGVLYMSWMLKRDEHILEKINMLCLDGVCALFEEHNRENELLIDELREITTKLRTAMNGNRADLSKVIQERVPMLLANELEAKFNSLNATFGAHLRQMTRVLEQLPEAQSQMIEKLARLSQDARRDDDTLSKQLGDVEKLLIEIRDSLSKMADRS